MSESARAEIRAIIDDRLAAIAAHDAARAMRAIADDVVAFELVPPLALPAGAARDEAGFAAWLAGFERIGVEVSDLHIEADETVGYARALHHLCFRRIGGAWQIVHAHSSVPFYPDGSFRAAIDLKP